VYWTINDPLGEWKLPNDDSIPIEKREILLLSDSVMRPDHGYIFRKEFEIAEKEKY